MRGDQVVGGAEQGGGVVPPSLGGSVGSQVCQVVGELAQRGRGSVGESGQQLQVNPRDVEEPLIAQELGVGGGRVGEGFGGAELGGLEAGGRPGDQVAVGARRADRRQ